MIVSNTGPIIALAKIDQLSLLEQMFTKVHIPPVVHRELLAKSGPESARLDTALSHFFEIAPPPQMSAEVKTATSRLDPGEQYAVALAFHLKALLLMDDRLGRRAAQQLSVPVTGVVGLLIRAKEANLVSAVRPLLNDMQKEGYWLSDVLLDTAAKLAGESN